MAEPRKATSTEDWERIGEGGRGGGERGGVRGMVARPRQVGPQNPQNPWKGGAEKPRPPGDWDS
jgi:hypothetical protein